MSNRAARVPEQLKEAYRLARAAGWTVSPNGSGLLSWTSPDGPVVTTGAGRIRDRHTLANQLGNLRRAGLPVPHRGGNRGRKHRARRAHR